jgi:serine protease Do
MVSYLGPFDAYWEYVLDRAIMTTVMSPGVGGGPMFDLRGRMVGVVSLNLNEVGRLSLAVPVENFLDHRESLLRHGRRPDRSGRAWMGLYCHTLQEHVVILGVLPGGPGERAGLRAGDVVLAIDASPVSDRGSFYRQLWSHRAGEAVGLQIFRQNQVLLIEVPTTSVEDMFA